MTPAEVAADAGRPEVERVAALRALKDAVDAALLDVAPALVAEGGPVGQAALDGLERWAFADAERVEPIARQLADTPGLAAAPGWPRLLGTLGTPWARTALRALAVDDAGAREELARLGEDVAAPTPEEAAHLRRLGAQTRAFAALDQGSAPPALVDALLATEGYALIVKLWEAGCLDAAGRARLAGFAPPDGLSKGQRALARRLAALVSPPG
ncbi:MAG: hypothetical protein H6706_05800 [Myxococcales bacterium]|nr:hypothetical protein [Myxococcales bacterium]